jgi:lipopolysaccharide transport system permease protein
MSAQMESRLENTKALVVIEPEKGLFNLQIRELIKRWFLIKLLIRRDFVAQYKQSVLGPLWHIITPLLSTLVFTVVFGGILGIQTEGVPHVLFYLSGVVLWSFFSSSFQKTATTFIENQALFTKVYFPRLSISIATILMRGITLGVQLALFLAVWIYYLASGYAVLPTMHLLFFPLLVLQLGLLAFGTGLIAAAVTVKYRDISHLVIFLTQLWMYATPIVYPLSQVPENWRWAMALNPVAPVVELFRYGFLGAGTPSLSYWGISLLMTGLFCLLGALLFSRVERTFVDTI